MSEASPNPPDGVAEPEAEAQAPPRRRGAVVGAVLAVTASAGLAWYLTRADTPPQPPAKPQVAAIAPKLQKASLIADPGQVGRAYEQVQTVYAEQGVAGLVRFSESCAETLEQDARVLDFCLAFDMFASAVAPPGGADAAWFHAGEARRLRLTRAALPAGADAQARLAAVEQLMRQASGADAEPEPAAAPVATPNARPKAQRAAAPAPETGAAARQKLRAAIVRRAAAKPARRDPCRFESTPADRLICGDAGLKAADQRMRQAYVSALAAGADPEVLEREQDNWRRARHDAGNRRALADLYARRIDDLEQAAEPPIAPPQ